MSLAAHGFGSRQGERSSRHTETLTLERVRAFAHAVASTTGPLAGVPPTFPTCFRHGEFELFEKLGIPLAAVLHAEQEFHYQREFLSGETVSFDSVLEHVLEKKGDPAKKRAGMAFLTFSTKIVDSKNEPVAVSRTTIVVREQR